MAPQGTVPWANAIDPTILTDESVGNMVNEVGAFEQMLQAGVETSTAMPILNRAAAQVTRVIKFVIAMWGSMPQGSGSSGGSPGVSNRSAMEHKAIMNLKVQGSERTGYRMWHERLANAFARA